VGWVLRLLYKEIGQLTTELSWLKKNLATFPRKERVELLERKEAAELPITKQAKLLGLSRSSLYYRPKEPSMEEVRIIFLSIIPGEYQNVHKLSL
jgi:putative transposase